MRTLIIVAAVLIAAQAASITWTGYAYNNQWDTPTNWYPAQVPAANDDVTIASGNVQVPGNGACNSVTMGTQFDTPANLTVFGQFYVGNGGLNVAGNGNLIINSGDASVIASGAVAIGGTLSFMSGSISGKWTGVGKVDLGGPAQKILSGCSFQMKGNCALSGVILMKESSVMKLMGPITASGDLVTQQDSSSVLIDTTATSLTYTGGSWIVQATMKLGDLTLVSGNISLFVETTFSKTLPIPQGSSIITLGTSTVAFNAGVSGAGTVVAQGNVTSFGPIEKFDGNINACGGICQMSTGSVAGMLLCGGSLTLSNNINVGSFSATTGTVLGSGVMTAEYGELHSKGVNINAAIAFTSNVSIMPSLMTFSTSGSMTFSTTSYVTAGVMQLTGALNAPGIINNGFFSAGGDISISNVGFTGTGNIELKKSLLQTQTNTFQQTNVTLSQNSAIKGFARVMAADIMAEQGTIEGVIGGITFRCDPDCKNVNTPKQPTADFNFHVVA